MSKRLLDQRWPWWVAATVILGVFASTFVDVRLPRFRDPRPVGSAADIEALAQRDDVNVLFILIDTLRAEHLSSYGYARNTSPELDAIAAKGLRFHRHLSQSSWTKCSMASLWSGLYPVRNGVTRYDDVLHEDARVPAEILKESGFQTIAIYRNGWVAPNFGFEQGFDAYTRPALAPLPAEVRRENPTLRHGGTDQDVVSAAREFLRVRGQDRWFLYLHLMDVHEYVYDEESALFGGDYKGIYDASIRWTDGILGDFIRELADSGYGENTLIVFASDHGEAFRERGLEGHARFVYRETTEVPLIFHFPFQLDPGLVIGSRTRNVDIWPTILDMLGLEVPSGIDGRSLLPTVLAAARGEDPPAAEEPAIAHLDQNWGRRELGPDPTIAVVDDRFRYIRLRSNSEPVEELFDMQGDPRELSDLSEEDAETVERLRGVAMDYIGKPVVWGEAPTREIEDLELNQLRALGYAIP